MTEGAEGFAVVVERARFTGFFFFRGAGFGLAIQCRGTINGLGAGRQAAPCPGWPDQPDVVDWVSPDADRLQQSASKRHPSPLVSSPFSAVCAEFRARSGKHWYLRAKSSKIRTYAQLFGDGRELGREDRLNVESEQDP